MRPPPIRHRPSPVPVQSIRASKRVRAPAGLRQRVPAATFRRAFVSRLSLVALSVVILLADGVRPDTLAAAMHSGTLPALTALRDEGALHIVTSCFPSVTGPAYAPFLMGRFPGPIGLPGLRWFDRARTACTFPDYSRSYVGYQMGAVDRDIAADAPTIFELTDGLGALSVIGRGLPVARRVGRVTLPRAIRAARTHFTGNVRGWLDIDRDIADMLVDQVRRDRPEFVFGAFAGVDKTSHAAGHASPMVIEALRIVDDAASTIRRDAERLGYWRGMSMWIVSDHGHSPVRGHEDLAGIITEHGLRTLAHPWVFTPAPDVAVMVSGNAMAHLYLELGQRTRPTWPSLASRWGDLLDMVLRRPSVDLAILPRSDGVEVRSASRGAALIRRMGAAFDYRMESGDPLGVGSDVICVSADEAHAITFDGDYPDGIVQIALLATAPRSGDIILSAARDWDFRARYEPIPHVSSHGALHREHMLVPLIVNQPVHSPPRRTVDVMPSALAALGKAIPAGLDGTSFL